MRTHCRPIHGVLPRTRQLSVAGAATSVPRFVHMTPEARSRLVQGITDELEPILNSYSDGGELLFAMSTHIALAA